MTTPDPAPDAAHERRKRLSFRAQYRGMRELDLLVGGFAKSEVPGMDEAALDEFEAILAIPDTDLYDWACARAPVPTGHDGPVLRRLLAWRIKEA